ncbi:MAG: ferredoxin--NADP reductase [Burkholderia sp.]|nr:ferredoxin--NADP reductase [Burkholderia sp.]
MNADTPAVARAKLKATRETVTVLHRWTGNAFTFTTTKPPGYSFTAGQYARLGLADDGDIIWRAYSMTSAPSDEFLEFYGILVPNGLFTGQLKQIKPGDPIWIEKQNHGFMTPDRFTDGEDLWMLATGTGVGPYISMLRDPYVWGKFRRLILVHGVRHANEFAYREDLEQLEQQPPASVASPASLQVIQATTREPATQPGQLHGRITALLDSGALEEAAGVAINEQTSRIMLCGNPDMIEDTRKVLHGRGLKPVRRLTPGQFVTENYW